MPKSAFASEYLGEFIDADGSVFSDFKSCIGDYKLDYSLPVYMSIDWGTGLGSDYTAITLGQLNNNRIYISDSIAFNDRNANQTIDYILSLVKSCINQGCKEVNIKVEKNSIGNVFFQILSEKIDEYETTYNDTVAYDREIEINASTFLTTNKSKETVIKQLIKCFEDNLIPIPNDDTLTNEVRM